MKIFENRRVKGAVSIFLVMITIPTMLLSAVLIDGSRMTSAKAMAQEATDLAAASVMASYNQTLKDQFGLFAFGEKDQKKLEAIFKESLDATLLAYGMDENAGYSERLWDIMKTTVTGNKSYMGESFLNLYDFQVDGCKVEPLYALANQDVLENQMVEYAKFRGLYVMADRMDLFSSLGNAKEEAGKNEVAADVMERKMEVDEANSSADRELARLREELEALNDRVGEMKPAKDRYVAGLEAKMEEIRIEQTDSEDELSEEQTTALSGYEERRRELGTAAEAACRQAGTVLAQAEKAKTEVEAAIERLEDFQVKQQHKAAGNESVASLVEDAKDNVGFYREEYLTELQKILDDPVIRQMDQDAQIKSKLNRVTEEIHEAITKYIHEIERMKEESGGDDSEDDGEEDEESEELEITEYFYYYLDSSEKTTDAESVVNRGGTRGGYRPAVEELVGYFAESRWDSEALNPSNRYTDTQTGKIDENFAENQSGKSGSPDTSLEGEAARGSVEKSVYDVRPSKTWKQEEGKSNNTRFFNKNSSLTASKSIMNQGKRSMILDIGETARDDILCLTYMFGTFKTRLTGVKKFSSEGMSDADRNFYMPKWRYAHPDGELDMRLNPKKDRDTVLRSEIEYLVYGNRTDQANETAVYATIFAERMANNMIAMYGEKRVVNPSCHAAAALASAATFGIVPETVFFWIFLTAWSTAETVIEMDYLISGGYRIPLFKTSKNILLNEIPDRGGDGLISNYGEKGIFVTYEDYLLILLLLKGREKRIMRTADLIEMNMKKAGQSDFVMSGAYTWLHGETDLSIRYLFGAVQPFQESYEEQGYRGRMRFNNTIYQGY